MASVADETELFQNRMPDLAAKMANILHSRLRGFSKDGAGGAGADCLEAVGQAVIARSAELRGGPQRRAQKKKALVDLLHGLRALGLSSGRGAVPQVHLWNICCTAICHSIRLGS